MPCAFTLLERAPGAFVRDANPVSRTLLVFCINQGVSTSFSLTFLSSPLDCQVLAIKGPQQYITRNTGLDEAQAGIKIARRNINNFRYTDDTTLMAESEEELKSFLMRVKEESEKAGNETQHSKNEDHDIWSHHFMGNRWGNSVRLYFLGSKSLQMVIAAMKLKDTYSLEGKLWPTWIAY